MPLCLPKPMILFPVTRSVSSVIATFRSSGSVGGIAVLFADVDGAGGVAALVVDVDVGGNGSGFAGADDGVGGAMLGPLDVG